MKVLVAGGAGYIGSFMARTLKDNGHDVYIVDSLECGHKESVLDFPLEVINLATEKEKLDNYFSQNKFDAVIHMASYIQMGESFTNPSKYYSNNLSSTINLLDAMVKNNCKNIVFSSSAGVYGNPKRLPIEEDDNKNPLNPYGETKYIIERMLDDYNLAHGINYMIFRYFNAAGASMDGSLGEAHNEESHLIPNVIIKAIKDEEIEIFGDDYKTEDGTCVRDYVHVLDLTRSHLMGLEALENGKKSNIYNIGLGRGYSNNEIVKLVEKHLGKKLNVKYTERRKGDADALFASIEKIDKELGWKPEYDIDKIIESALLWHTKHPDNYPS